jgi:hypothetical protein
MTVPRRGFLKKGILGGALLLIGGGAGLALRGTRLGKPARKPLRLLSPAEHAVLAAIAARVVPGEGAPAAWPSAEAVDCAGKIDALLALAHPAVGEDFKRLLGLFENGLTGLFVDHSPTPFTRLEPADQDARLEAWRRSRLALLRSGYQALVRLVHAAYFSSPEVYPAVGYPGPPGVPT